MGIANCDIYVLSDVWNILWQCINDNYDVLKLRCKNIWWFPINDEIVMVSTRAEDGTPKR